MTDTNAATETIIVALNKLDRDPLNVRKTYSKEGIEELAATIRGDGYRILQNLVVRKGDKRGRFFVTAGGRRHAALDLLAELGEIAKDFAVECKERSAAEATEISLIENMQREAMHPVDEYDAFRVMADAGKSVEDIAARFGTTEGMVVTQPEKPGEPMRRPLGMTTSLSASSTACAPCPAPDRAAMPR